MSRLRVPPGRAGRLWLRRRVETARRGADLLDRKVRVLRVEEQRLRSWTDESERTWKARIADAEIWLARAVLTGGRASVDAVGGAGTADVTVRWRSTMGVRHPVAADYHLPPPSPTAAGPTTAALVTARQAFAEAAAAGAEYAAARAAADRLSAEIAATRQRVRALERRWIPRLDEAVTRVEFELEEQEREEAARRRSQSAPTASADNRRS